jgi:hypothetical protein
MTTKAKGQRKKNMDESGSQKINMHHTNISQSCKTILLFFFFTRKLIGKVIHTSLLQWLKV